MEKNVIRQLRKILGRGGLSTAKEDLVCAAYDATRMKGKPEALARPETAQQVSEILILANKERFPVYPAGARSGLTGGAVPLAGGVLLDLTRMKKIVDINTATRTAVAQAGILLGDFQKELENKGFFYPPDPASADFATLGGTLAECAGGLRCVKYGVTRDYVLGMEAVLPTGEIIRLGSKAVKNVVGYDLMRLIVGSEGTLAVITEATVRIVNLPETVKTIIAYFPDVESAVRTVGEILASGSVPRMVELADSAALHASAKYTGVKIPSSAGAAVFVEIDGRKAAVEADARDMIRILKKSGGKDIREAETEKERENLLTLRRNISPALYNIASGKVNEDVSVPLDALAAVFRTVVRLGKKHGIETASFAHAGDGNVHVNFLFDDDDDGARSRAEEAAGELFREVVALGGSISGEHGIGISKQEFIRLELSDTVIDVMKRIKRLLDPLDVLNPGKIFPND